MRFRTKRHTDDRGQALVEFALVAPLLILLIVGVFEVAQAWQAYQAVTDAAREVARNAVVDEHLCSFTPAPGFCSSIDVTDLSAVLSAIVAERIGRSGLDPAALTMVVADVSGTPTDPSTIGTGEPVFVNLTYDYKFVFVGALLAWVTGDRTIALKSEFVMRKE